MKTNIKNIDNKITALKNKHLIILAARPSHGKSSLAFQISYNAIQQEKNVALFSLEMSQQEVMNRMLSMASRVPNQKIENGKGADDNDIENLRQAAEKIGPMSKHLFVSEVPQIKVSSIRSMISRLKKINKVDLVIVDHLQLVEKEEQGMTEEERTSYVSRNLKIIAKEYDLPVLALCQLSRDVEKRTKMKGGDYHGHPDLKLSDLRHSGAIEQDADIVMFISRKDLSDKEDRVVRFYVAKQRNGPIGQEMLLFNGPTMDFESYDPNVLITSQEQTQDYSVEDIPG